MTCGFTFYVYLFLRINNTENHHPNPYLSHGCRERQLRGLLLVCLSPSITTSLEREKNTLFQPNKNPSGQHGRSPPFLGNTYVHQWAVKVPHRLLVDDVF